MSNPLPMTPSLTLNDANLVLVNRLRNLAVKGSQEFNAVKFFADADYAKSCLARLAASDSAELADLARTSLDTLFAEQRGREHAVDETLPLRRQPQPELTSAERFVQAKEMMNSMVVDAVGLRSFFFVLKLERCGNSADLVKLLEDFETLIAKGSDPASALAMKVRVKRLLA